MQLRADQFRVKQSEVALNLALQKLETLREITQKKMLIGFDADIETAEATLAADEDNLNEEELKLKDIEEQIANCNIVAPEAGQVVHSNKFSSRGGSAEFVVEPGAMVRQRQVIIRLARSLQHADQGQDQRVPGLAWCGTACRSPSRSGPSTAN